MKILPLFILVLPGLIAFALFPGIVGDDAYPVLLASNILPIGIKGLVVAGLLSAIMSSLAGVFNTTSTLFVNDFYLPRYPSVSDRKLVLIGRLSTTFIVITAILCVPLVKIISNQMYLFLQSVQGFISPPIAAVFIIGLLFKKITSRAAFWTLIIGEAIGFSRLISELLVNIGYTTNKILVAYSNINFLHFAILLFIVSTTLLFSLSYAGEKTKDVEVSSIKYSLRESFSEFMISFPAFNRVRTYRTNILMSGFILLLIFGVWSLWS